MSALKPLLGDLLQKAKLITKEQLNEALREQKKEGKRLGSVLMNLGYLKEEDLVGFLSRQYNVPGIKLSVCKFDRSLFKLVPYHIARKHYAIPIHKGKGVLRVAVADPSNHQALSEISSVTGLRVSVYVAAQSAIIGAIERQYTEEDKAAAPYKASDRKTAAGGAGNAGVVSGSGMTQRQEGMKLPALREGDAPVPTLVDEILNNAIKSRATDLHIEPAEDTLRVRFRIDGVLHHVLQLPIRKGRELIERMKELSRIDPSEQGLPRDGRMKLSFGEGREIDCRVSLFPTLFGEKVVVKILDKSFLELDLSQLGFEGRSLDDLRDALERASGLILIAGPAGSGKTTTLYSALSHLNKPGVNIMTIEDPVVYHFPGINQGQVNEETGMTFPSALQTLLRQDPNIIMVSELRGAETAEIAIQAAITGHLVLSTLYTPDTASSITRLVDMGIKPFLLSSALILVVSQRLVRRICDHCKREQKISETTLISAGFTPDEAKNTTCFTGRGCGQCDGTGYVGRTALYEVMPVKGSITDLILREASAVDLKREAVAQGMRTLRRCGIGKVRAGITSLDEVIKVTPGD